MSFIDSIRSLAVIGATKKRGYFFLKTFVDTFKGKLYVIKPNITKIEDFPTVEVFKRLTDIPDDKPVDMAFISIPREKVMPVIEDCHAKGVKLVSVFTSNFADEGTEEGRKMQDALLKYCNIGEGSLRILGPNGMGLYFPKLGLRWRPSLPVEHGDAGLVIQSGGFANLVIHGLTSEHVRVSKTFSIGNAADVDALDVFNYFINDPETNLIIQYLEGLPAGRGREYLNLIRECKKPVILLKGGRTKTGALAANTHTAALVGNIKIWENVVSQAGAILVDSFIDLINTAKYLKMVGKKKIQNACMISISGGYGVVCSDVLEEHGVHLPDFRKLKDTNEKLTEIMNFKGTSHNNPLDLAVTFVNTEVLEQVLKIVLEEDSVDGIIIEIATYILVHPFRSDMDIFTLTTDLLLKLKKKQEKPIIVITQDVGDDEIRKRLKEKMQSNNIPVYTDVLPLARVLRYINRVMKVI
ncbi:MAG: CoA-binding protein [Candidatus Hodarchaeota archaeon]